MRKILSIILSLIVVMPIMAGENDFSVERLSHAEGVTINGIAASKVKYFSKTAVIRWGKDDAAAMLVKETSTSKLYRLSKRQFDSKGQIKTLEEFFLRTNKTSTRSGVDEAIVTIKQCRNRFSFKEKRVALVVGNAAYTFLPSLQNPQSDAAAVSDKLLSLGFDVVESYDCNDKEFRSLLNQFELIVNRDGYQVVLFYYAGHGIQKDNKNYLIPVSTPLQKPGDVNNCIGCDEVLRSLEGTLSSSRIIIFDACRNFSSAISDRNQKGLAQIQRLAPGTMLIYSTGFGQVANDGEGEHSPFVQALLDNIGKANTNFELEMKDVARETYRLTANQQYPAIAGSLTDNLILNPSVSNVSTRTVTSNTQTAQGLKASDMFTNSEADFEYGVTIYLQCSAYINDKPYHNFASEIKGQLEKVGCRFVESKKDANWIIVANAEVSRIQHYQNMAYFCWIDGNVTITHADGQIIYESRISEIEDGHHDGIKGDGNTRSYESSARDGYKQASHIIAEKAIFLIRQ